MDIRKLAEDNFDYMVRHRRHLHEHPELSGQEEETVAYICAELEKLGIEHVNVPQGGVVGYIYGSQPGKRVLLRADIDALPVEEPENNLTQKRVCRSQNPGVMHACGHDAHTAMLLGAAKILQENRNELRGSVMLVFERGEEGGGNIRYLLQYFEKEHIHYDSCFGMHVEQKLDTGTFAVSEGPCDAGSVPIDFKITGRGGHGSRPDLANNPIDCMRAVMDEIYAIRGKYISPFDQLTTTICKVRAGIKGNIIPDTAEFEGSARYFSPEAARIFREQLDRIAKTCGEAYNCEVENRGRNRAGAWPIINDPYASALAKRAVEQVIGAENWRPTVTTMGSESFSQYCLFAPGCYGNLGVRTPEKGSGAEIHNQYFDIDEEAMKVGVSVHVAYAVNFLADDTPISFTPKVGSVEEIYKA